MKNNWFIEHQSESSIILQAENLQNSRGSPIGEAVDKEAIGKNCKQVIKQMKVIRITYFLFIIVLQKLLVLIQNKTVKKRMHYIWNG